MSQGGSDSTERFGKRYMLERRKHLSRTGWTLADQAIVSLGSFLINIQLARHLPIGEYGVFALLFSVIFLFQHCCIALLVYPMSLRVAATPGTRDAELTSTTMVMVAVCILSFSTVLAGAITLAGRSDIAWAAGIFSALWLLQDAMRRGLMAEFRHRTASIGDTISYFSQAAFVAYLVRKGTLTLAGALLLMGCACAAGGLVQLRMLQLPWPQLGGVRQLVVEYWQTGKWAVTSGLLMHMRLQLFPWALGLVHGTAATAAFQAMMNIANLTNPVVFGLCNTISQSVAQTRARTSNKAAWGTARYYALLGAPFVVLYAVAVFAVPGFVLQLFYGTQSPYLGYELPLRLIMIAIIVNYVAEIYSAFLYGVDGGRVAFGIALVGLAVAVTGAMTIGPWAVAGAAFAMLIANLARLVPSYRSMDSIINAAPEPGRGKGEE